MATGQRLYYLDNIRWVMILLVISMHAADTYSPLGSWYFVQRPPLDPATLLFFAAWQMYLQAFFMGLLFFVAGYFSPASLMRKGAAKFLKDRAFRLGLPVLFYMLVLGPVLEYFVAKSWTSTDPTSFANEWVKHIRNGEVLQENGPLWFCLLLLIFSVVYARLGFRPAEPVAKAPGTRELALFALAMAGLEFALRLTRPGSFLNLHPGDFAQYVLMFAAGISAGRGGWLERFPHAKGVRWLGWTLCVGFAWWLAMLGLGGGFAGKLDAYSGGWHWQSAAFDLWESFTCVGVSAGLLVVFRERFNSRGKVAAFLSDNAFAVYVFHPLILIGAARVMYGAEWPAFVKFVALAGITAVVTFGLSATVFRRVPLLRAIL